MPFRLGPTAGRRARQVRLHLEPLEDRFLLSPVLIQDAGGNATLDQAQSLGTLTGPTDVMGAINNTATNPADVHWYSFALTRPADVTLSGAAGPGQCAPVVSLYNSDPNDFADPYDPLGNRLLAQATAAAGTSDLYRPLAAGTYFVAVSGAGNLDFNPFLADSGYPGQPCAYTLALTETDLPLQATDGPVVLASDPAAGAQLTSSPLVIRLSVSTQIDPNTVQPDQTVRLTYNPTGAFGGPNDVDIPLANVNFTAQANELQLTPQAALTPGYYQVYLAGNSVGGVPVVADLNGTPLGTDATHPQGQDFTETFQVVGVDGNVGPGAATDDTAATSIQLGDVTGVNLVQVAGTIGDDPAYDPNNSNPNLTNPAAQVNLYHFQVSGPGVHQFTAEVFAGRIGSPLDAGLSLFSKDPTSGTIQLVVANDNSLNDTTATNGTAPLYTDPVLYAGLTAGDYYLAVSGTGNVPDPAEGQSVGVNGVFDPNIAHSGMNGFTTGDYVLNLQVGAATVPPQVVSVSLAQGGQLDGPPGTFTVTFSKPVNLPQLAETAFQQSPSLTLSSVFIRGSNGTDYHARLLSYDPTQNQATFLMLDAVPSGATELHLSGSGPLALTDLAGNSLVGNGDPSGDYVVSFTVGGAPRGSNGNPQLWLATEPNDTQLSPQILGVLFPDELQSGVTVQRTASQPTPVHGADYFEFQVLQSRQYFLTLQETGLPTGVLPMLTDASGNPITGIPQGRGGAIRFDLTAGTYIVSVGWSPNPASSVGYTLSLSLASGGDSPPALTTGPAPAIQVTYAVPTTVPTPPGPSPTPDPAPTAPPDEGTNATAGFVEALYHDVLGRAADAVGLAAWMGMLQEGMTRGQVSAAFWASPEHRSLEVASWYRAYLQRDGSAIEVADWVTVMDSGATEEDVEAAFLTSPEYTAAHADNASFVPALYQEMLGRAADPTGLAAWEGMLGSAVSRATVARDFVGSQEVWMRALDGFYTDYLHRGAGQSEAAFWLSTLDGGGSGLGAVAVAILSSDEYWATAQAALR